MALALALLWWIVTEGDLRLWWFGALIVVAATALSRLLDPPREEARRLRIAPWSLARFGALFLWESVLGGIGVAAAAFRPGREVAPFYQTYRLRIGREHEAARMSLAASMCLLPGTLSCELTDDALFLHVLDQGMYHEGRIRTYERALAAVFSLELPEDPGKT